MDAANIDVDSVKKEIKLEESDEPEQLPLYEVKEEVFENDSGQLFQIPNEAVILYKSERLQFEDSDIKSEINETYNCSYTLFEADLTSETDTNKHTNLKAHCREDIKYSESCGYQTDDKNNLSRLLAGHEHEEKIPKYECNECGFKTVHSSSLKRHLHQHRNSKKLKLYLYKPSMQNVECPNCDYQTNDRSNLRRHIIYHCVLNSGKSCKSNKTYTCYDCGHNASTKSNLKVHIFRKHRPKEEVKYCCEECNYQPVSKSDLQIHKLSHNNAKHMKVYKCFHCTYQTIYKVSIDRHMVSHKAAHEIEMYQCYLCKYKAVRKDELRNHILRHAKKPSNKSKR